MPDDNNTIPLINTIRETTLAAIAKKYKIETAQKRFDISHSQSDSEYITGAIGDYNDTIQDIIDNIPDDPPVPAGPSVFVLLPKSPASSFGGYNTVVEACDLDGNYIPYSRVENFITGNSSMICNCFNNSSTYGFVDTDVSVSSCIINNSGNVAWKSTRYYQNSWCAFCAFISDPTGVTVVDVFESQAPYRCFKSFYYDGKYFVLDKVQKQWVSDLSTLGYQTTPVDDVVYPFGAFCLTEISFSGYVSKYAKTWDNQYIGCNDGLGYSCIGAYRVNGTATASQFSFLRENTSTALYLKNESSSAYIYSAKFATQSKLPSVEKLYAKTLSGGSTAQSVTLQPNEISRWLYETIAQSSYMGFTPAVMNVSDGTNVIARKGVSALFDNTDGGQGTYSSYCISIRNDTGAALTCTYARVALCQSNLITVTVVNVYNSSNDAYNAFKYNDGTTDYYYVLDGTQTDWTSDLSSIGYHLPLPLPTVEIFADSSSGWCCTSSFPNTTNISSNYSVDLYNRDGGGTVTGRSSCDTSKKYSLIQWQAVQMVLEGRTEIEIESDTGYLRAKNVSNSAITFLQARIVVCSSSDATVEMVLDADNNRYNAFKYTVYGTDYYYVLDGTQTDWTDDLSSIGYSLTKNLPTVQNVQCWLAENKGSTGMSPPSFTTRVFDENNNRIPFSSDLLYCVFLVSSYPSADGEFDVVNSTNTTIAIHRENGTGYIDIYSVFYASCSDKTSTIIDVYDSQNNVFKAFKYTLDGVDYYRVMEWQNTHPDWVTDLSSIGYSLIPALPTVTKQQMKYVPWGSPGVTFLDGQSRTLYYNGSTVSYNNNVLYSVRANSTNSQTEPDYYYNHAFTVMSVNGSIGIYNGSGGDIYTEGCYLYTCVSNSSSLVTVYNSNNAEYYAFKYTTNGTDYYYVLDGTQDDWTNDLSSIGYSLYLKLTVLDGTQDRYCGPGSVSYLYLNGNSGGIVWVSGKYILISVYTLDGNQSPYTFSFGTSNGLMTLTSSSYSAVACYCYIQVS